MFKKIHLATFLLIFSLSVYSQKPQVGEIAFSGDKTVAEVVESLYANKTLAKGETIKINVFVPLRKQGEKSSLNLNGLPGNDKDTGLSIDIPFSSLDYIDDQGVFDVYNMGAKIDEVLSILTPDQYNKGLGDPLNQKNCGGFPVGTTITDTRDMGCLGSITNVYECQVYGGQANWYVTSTTTTSSICIEP